MELGLLAFDSVDEPNFVSPHWIEVIEVKYRAAASTNIQPVDHTLQNDYNRGLATSSNGTYKEFRACS